MKQYPKARQRRVLKETFDTLLSEFALCLAIRRAEVRLGLEQTPVGEVIGKYGLSRYKPKPTFSDNLWWTTASEGGEKRRAVLAKRLKALK